MSRLRGSRGDRLLELYSGAPARTETNRPLFGAAPRGGRRRLAGAHFALLAMFAAIASCTDDSERPEAVGTAGSSAGTAAAVSGAGGGSGMNQPPAAPEAGAAAKLSFAADVYEPVIRKRCGNCHNDAPSFGGLAFFPGGAATAYGNLVGVPAGNQDGYLCRASGLVRVAPGEPEASLMYLKLTNPPCGSQMPPVAFGFATDEEKERVRRWIADGAAP